MSILNKLIESNEPPVLFIGTGISKRYIQDFPTWEELLLKLWERLDGKRDTFYKKMLQIKTENEPLATDADNLMFTTNIKMASLIMQKFTEAFNSGQLEVKGLTTEQAFQTQINPFKKEIANIFEEIEFKKETEEEIEAFRKLLLKSRAIITTNYDTALECLMEDEYKVYTRQSDLFMLQDDYGSIYKVHGDVNNSNEIIITESDYEKFDKNSVLIGAKLISLLMESPIIFLGYSLKDQNIISILKKFTQSLRPEQKGMLVDRMVYIDYKEGQEELTEYKKDSAELGAQFTVIETDNYRPIYEQLAQIEQGLPVSQVRKFKDKIKELIIEHGKKGTLKKLLLSPYELDEDKIPDDDIVIAIGDNKIIFNIPDRVDYLRDYMNETQEIPTSVALKFIARQGKTTRIPIFKFTKNIDFDTNLSPVRSDEIEKIKQRINDPSILQKAKDTIPTGCRIRHNNLA